MCVNDILCQGAKPLFFLDYIATGKVQAEKVAEIVKGIADGCVLAGCALVGGETAEMPDFYSDGEYDMAGFAVGVVGPFEDNRRIRHQGRRCTRRDPIERDPQQWLFACQKTSFRQDGTCSFGPYQRIG